MNNVSLEDLYLSTNNFFLTKLFTHFCFLIIVTFLFDDYEQIISLKLVSEAKWNKNLKILHGLPFHSFCYLLLKYFQNFVQPAFNESPNFPNFCF